MQVLWKPQERRGHGEKLTLGSMRQSLSPEESRGEATGEGVAPEAVATPGF